MPLRGSVKDIHIADLIQLLSRAGKVGTIKVTSPGAVHRFDISPNEITLSIKYERLGTPTRLGELLVEAGRITDWQLKRALLKAREQDQRIGDALVAEGLVSRQDIEDAVDDNFRATLFEIFLLEEGDIEFSTGQSYEQGSESRQARISMNTDTLVNLALEQLRVWERLRRKLPPMEAVVTWEASGHLGLDKMELSDAMRVELRRIDGRPSLGELLAHARVPRDELYLMIDELFERKLIRTLSATEVLRRAQEAERRQSFEDARRLFEYGTVLDPGEWEFKRGLLHALKALDERERLHDLRIDFAEESLKEGQLERASRLYQQAVDREPDNTELLGKLFEVQHRRSDPAAVTTGEQWVDLLKRSGQPFEAVKVLKWLADINPLSKARYYQMTGEIHQNLRNERDAYRMYDAADAAYHGDGTGDRELLTRILRGKVETNVADADAAKRLKALGTAPRSWRWWVVRPGLTALVILGLLFVFLTVRYLYVARLYVQEAQALEGPLAAPADNIEALSRYEMVVREFSLSFSYDEAQEGLERVQGYLKSQLEPALEEPVRFTEDAAD